MIKQNLNSILFVLEQFIEHNDIHDAFVNEKAGNSALDRTFWVSDSTNDTLDKETTCGALLILIVIVIVRASKVAWIQRIVIVA